MNRKITLSLALTLLAFSSLVTASISFAWIMTTYPFANLDNKPGEIEGMALSKAWNIESALSNKWETFTTATPPRQDMGEMLRIDVLPDNHVSYYMFNFEETSDINTNYFLVMEKIEIFVYSNFTNSEVVLEDISYYNSEPDQAAYYFKAARSNSSDLDPTTLFNSDPGTKIASEKQIISPIDLGSTEFLYLMFYLSLDEIQNIIDIVPIEHTPYNLSFEFSFNLEKRTIDEY